MMTAEFRKRFLELKVTGQRFAMSSEYKREKDLTLIEYLKRALEHNEFTGFEDVGFYKHVKDRDPVYLPRHLSVSYGKTRPL